MLIWTTTTYHYHPVSTTGLRYSRLQHRCNRRVFFSRPKVKNYSLIRYNIPLSVVEGWDWYFRRLPVDVMMGLVLQLLKRCLMGGMPWVAGYSQVIVLLV